MSTTIRLSSTKFSFTSSNGGHRASRAWRMSSRECAVVLGCSHRSGPRCDRLSVCVESCRVFAARLASAGAFPFDLSPRPELTS